MISENVQKYAYAMMFINLAFILVNVAGIFSISYTIGGYDAIEDITDSISEITTKFQNAGNTLQYILVVGFMIIEGVKLIILFLLLAFFGLAAIFEVLSVPVIIYGPIIVVINAIILYDFAKMLLKISG